MLIRMNKYCEIALLTSSSVFPDLGLLFSLVLMGMLVFGSLAYYIENEEEDTGFYSIPQVVLLTVSDDIDHSLYSSSEGRGDDLDSRASEQRNCLISITLTAACFFYTYEQILRMTR